MFNKMVKSVKRSMRRGTPVEKSSHGRTIRSPTTQPLLTRWSSSNNTGNSVVSSLGLGEGGSWEQNVMEEQRIQNVINRDIKRNVEQAVEQLIRNVNSKNKITRQRQEFFKLKKRLANKKRSITDKPPNAPKPSISHRSSSSSIKLPDSSSNSNNQGETSKSVINRRLPPIRTEHINQNININSPVVVRNNNNTNKVQKIIRNQSLVPNRTGNSFNKGTQFISDRIAQPRTFFKSQLKIKELPADVEKLIQDIGNLDSIRYHFNKLRKTPYTKQEILTKLRDILHSKRQLENKKTKSLYPLQNQPRRTSPTGLNIYKGNNIDMSPRNLQISLERKRLMASRRFHTNQSSFNTNKGRHDPSVINTREYTIPKDIFTKTVQTNRVLQKIYTKIKPILIQRKLYDPTKHKLLVNFIYHFIHQQTTHIHPKKLTGEMVDIVIDNPEDLCNFLYLQKMDIQHDFGGSATRIQLNTVESNNSTDSNQTKQNKAKKRANVAAKEKGIKRIRQFVNGSIESFIDSFKTNIETMNPGKSEEIGTMFTHIKNNIHGCYVAQHLDSKTESQIFGTLRGLFARPIDQGGIKDRKTQIFAKQFKTLDILKGHPEIPAIYDAASMKEVKVSYDNFKNYIDLVVLADAGQSLRQGFYSFLVDSYERYIEQIDTTRTSGWGYIQESLFGGVDDTEFKEFYITNIEKKLPKLSNIYVAKQFVDFVELVHKEEKINTDTIIKNIFTKLKYYKQFMYLQNNQSASPFLFNFTTLGFRLYYKPSLSSKVVLLNEVIVTANQNDHPDSQSLSSSIINGQTDLPVGSSANATGSYIIGHDIPENEMYKYILSKTYGDFLLMIRGLSKNIKYITYDKLAASTYMMVGDIMQRNTTRVIQYTSDKTLTTKNFSPRVQMITESSNDGGGTRLLYVDSEQEPETRWKNIQGPNRGIRYNKNIII